MQQRNSSRLSEMPDDLKRQAVSMEHRQPDSVSGITPRLYHIMLYYVS